MLWVGNKQITPNKLAVLLVAILEIFYHVMLELIVNLSAYSSNLDIGLNSGKKKASEDALIHLEMHVVLFQCFSYLPNAF